VLDGIVSPEEAREVYGVDVDVERAVVRSTGR
jgi:hypothetical protein